MRSIRSRRQQILQCLIEQKSMQVAELVDRCEVSAVTIRADLSHFESKGMVTRTRGGATLVRELMQEQKIHERDMLTLSMND
ncbi:DeoR family transcriptional regulator [Pseudomonas sp. CGJS7]|uniref:DeoR family transcriptional regulator n=1 Tax=Pseudomonas sp. CGJS7 TaxID=3109348 RepID=UPI00300A1190